MDYFYIEFLKLFKNIPFGEFFGIILWYSLWFCIVAAFVLTVVIFLVLAERKILALFTARKGPNRVGFWGLLQTIADALKLLTKEDIIPTKATKFLFWIAPIIVFVPVIFVYFLIPLNSQFKIINSEVGAFLFCAILAFPIFGIMLAGWASNNKYSLIGAIRSVCQCISYEIPLTMSVLSIVILASSMNLNTIVLSQSNVYGIIGWYFLPSLLGCLIFFICMLAELNRVPFDLPEAESELTAGYNVEYSGMKFAMFFLSEYALLFVSAIFMSILFFGGYLSPFGFYITENLDISMNIKIYLIYFEQLFWLLIKTAIIIFIIMWIRATLPRLRYDKLLKFSWKYLLPFSILNFFIVCLIKLFFIGGF